MRRCSDPDARRAALVLLSRGLATPAEVSRLAGVTRQRVTSWALSANVNWRLARHRKLSKLWHVKGEDRQSEVLHPEPRHGEQDDTPQLV